MTAQKIKFYNRCLTISVTLLTSITIVQCSNLEDDGSLNQNFSLMSIYAKYEAPKLRRRKRDGGLAQNMEVMSLRDYKSNCNKGFDLNGVRSGIITTPQTKGGKYATGIYCKWTLIGSPDCQPTIRCDTFDMRKFGNTCSEEFFRIEDGLGGDKLGCGMDDFRGPFTTTIPANDLYVTLKISSKTVFERSVKGVHCTASCLGNIGGRKAIHLPYKGLVRKFDSGCACGVKKSGRVVGGTEALLNEFPWQAAIVATGTREPRCGGSLINDRYILTAAHCFHDERGEILPVKDIEVLLHAQLLDMTYTAEWKDVSLGMKGSIRGPGYNMKKKNDADEKTIRRNVAKIIPHEAYDNYNLDYDICLLQMVKPVDIKNKTSALGTICLPSPTRNEKEIVGKLMTAVGWGLADEDAGASTRLLQKIHIPFLSAEVCEKQINKTLTSRMQCAGHIDGGKDTCTGDSGGPLINDQKGTSRHSVQIGIVSHGEGCARKGQAGIYTRLSGNQALRICAMDISSYTRSYVVF